MRGNPLRFFPDSYSESSSSIPTNMPVDDKGWIFNHYRLSVRLSVRPSKEGDSSVLLVILKQPQIIRSLFTFYDSLFSQSASTHLSLYVLSVFALWGWLLSLSSSIPSTPESPWLGRYLPSRTTPSLHLIAVNPQYIQYIYTYIYIYIRIYIHVMHYTSHTCLAIIVTGHCPRSPGIDSLTNTRCPSSPRQKWLPTSFQFRACVSVPFV